MSKKSKENKRKLVTEAAERLAQILIMQVELSRLNSKEDAAISSQQEDIILDYEKYSKKEKQGGEAH